MAKRARSKKTINPKKQAKPREISWKEIQKEVRSWSPKELAEFVLDSLNEDSSLRSRV